MRLPALPELQLIHFVFVPAIWWTVAGKQRLWCNMHCQKSTKKWAAYTLPGYLPSHPACFTRWCSVAGLHARGICS